MSKYTCYYSKRKIFCRELAEKWSKWSKTASLTRTEVAGISKFFYNLGRRFGLIGEFRDLGII